MHEKYKDTDLREALRRKYADTPKLPADFNPSPRKGSIKSLPFWGRLVGAAACLLVIVGVGFILLHKEEPAKTEQMIVQQTKPKPISMKETAPKQVPMKPLHSIPSPAGRGRQKASPARGGLEEAADDSNLHYAANTPEEETVPYQDPARVDEFIEKMAAYHKIKEGELTCSATNDSNVVSRVYVFPDKKEIDVFGRLLQVACWYSDETPGYHLNFSHQQFFFELKDQRKQLQYCWIAERMNGKILLYGTHAPIGAITSSACYQEYRDELMHTKSINLKTKKI